MTTEEKTIEYKDLKWIQADEVPMPARRRGFWKPKLQEFLDGPHDIAFLQASALAEVKKWAGGLRNARTRLGLTGDDIRISEDSEQARVYVAKRLVPKPQEG